MDVTASPIEDLAKAKERFGGIGLGVLSWRGYKSLTASLASYEAAGLLNLVDERVLFFPEKLAGADEIAGRFGFRAEGSPENMGIMGGLEALARHLTSPIVLLLENDCPMIETGEEAARQLVRGMELLGTGQAQVIRMRSRRQPGEGFTGIAKYRRYHPAPAAPAGDRIKAWARRTVRPGKARRLIGNSLYAEPAAQQRFPRYVRAAADGFCLCPTAVMTWTNQSILIERRFFLDVILARAHAVRSRRSVNGFKNLEIELNDGWWRRQPWMIGVAPGLFTHRRLGDRGYRN